MGLILYQTPKTDEELKKRMAIHYSQPKGFIGRVLCYAIVYDDVYYGHIIGASAARHLPNRYQFFGLDDSYLNYIVNNIFFNMTRVDGKYPTRNFATKVLKAFVDRVEYDWYDQYGDPVFGFETMIEPPRTGDMYVRAGWTLVGMTQGITMKRTGGAKCGRFAGQIIRDKVNLRPKTVFCLRAKRRSTVKPYAPDFDEKVNVADIPGIYIEASSSEAA